MVGRADGFTEAIRDFLVDRTQMLTDVEFDCYMALVKVGKMNSHEVYKHLKESGIEHGSRTLISDTMKTLVNKKFASHESNRITPIREEHLYSPVKLEEALSPMIGFVNTKMHEKFDERFDFLKDKKVAENFVLHMNQEKTIKMILNEIKTAKDYVWISCGDCTWISDESKEIIKRTAHKAKFKMWISKRTDKNTIDWLNSNKVDYGFKENYPLFCIIDGNLMYLGFNDVNGFYHALRIPERALISDFERMLPVEKEGD